MAERLTCPQGCWGVEDPIIATPTPNPAFETLLADQDCMMAELMEV